ncbi:MAG: M20/M25/M40 family metallo-hydrolase [Lentisphaerae bacterium]|nr:M20/M25/M40 family metallo-hydrolase [Lentisphaerota bacterium]
MFDLMRRKAKLLEKDVVEFAARLVRTPSVTTHEADVAALVETTMRNIGYENVFRDDAGNVVSVIPGRRNAPTVLLLSHMDTVAPDEKNNWTHPPFDGVIENGRLHGVGSSDCKSGLAAQIFAGALLKRTLLPLEGNMIVAATVSEENGGSPGARALMENTLPAMQMKPDFAVLGEPTGLALYHGHDGWAQFDILVYGANQFQVDDAARAVETHLSERSRYSRQNRYSDQTIVARRPTQLVEGFHRGTIQLTRRMNEREDYRDVASQIHHNAALVAESVGSADVSVSIPQTRQRLYTNRTVVTKNIIEAWSTDPFNAVMERPRQALMAAGCKAQAGKWSLPRCGMATAGGLLLKTFGVPTIGYGPGNEETAHSANESVETTMIEQAMFGTAVIVHSLVGIPVCGWTADEI